MNEPRVRQVNFADLQSLGAALGDALYFINRFEQQKDGLGVLFGAWLGSRPVGVVFLWLGEAEEAPIRAHLPGVPLLTHLEVLPEFRNRTIGTRLIAEAEAHVRFLGRSQIALAVRTDNTAARRLYELLGYRDWGHGEVECFAVRTGPDGHTEFEPEACYVLVRDLPPG